MELKKEELLDIVEVHYGYKTAIEGEMRIAFEGKETGYTYSLDDIDEFEVFN